MITFEQRWWGYDRQQVEKLLKQMTEDHQEALEKAGQLLAILDSENGQLEAEIQHLQERFKYYEARAKRLQESSDIVDMLFTIMKEALVTQRREIFSIAVQMSEELNQRCEELNSSMVIEEKPTLQLVKTI